MSEAVVVDEHVEGANGLGLAFDVDAMVDELDDQLKGKTINLYARLALCQSQLGKIAKTGKFKQGEGQSARIQYTYLSDADVVGALAPLMARVGLTIFPTGCTVDGESQVGAEGRMRRVVLSCDWTVADAITGEMLIVKGIPGEGIDTFDKAYNKALTSARKNALRMIFLVAGEDDPEASKQQAQSAAPSRPPQQPAQAQQGRPAPAQQQAVAARPAAVSAAAPPPSTPTTSAPASSSQLPPGIPAPVDGSCGWEPWGAHPVNIPAMASYISAELKAHGWTEKASRDGYIRSKMTPLAQASEADKIEALKRFYREAYMGTHNPVGLAQ